MTNIILIGFMGSGKTSCGKAFAKLAGIEFYDTDEMIEKEQNMTITNIFSKYGEKYFRELETELVKSLAGRDIGVLSVGGGLPITDGNPDLLKKIGIVIYLKAGKETLIKRLRHDNTRPLLHGGNLEQKITDLMNEREDKYIASADEVIETDDMSVSEIANKILQVVNEASK